MPGHPEGRAHAAHVRLARRVKGHPLDPVRAHRGVQVGVVHRLLRQDPQPGVLAAGQDPGLGRYPVLPRPGKVLLDLAVDQARPRGPHDAPAGPHAGPRGRAEILLTAEVRVRVGVVDPVEVLRQRPGCYQQRVDAVLGEPGRGAPVVEKLDLEVVLLFPLRGVGHVGRGHPDDRGHRRAARADAGARRAVADLAPLGVSEEHVVVGDVQVVAPVAEVHAAGDPVHDAVRQVAELQVVTAVPEAEPELLPPAMVVLPHERATAR